MYLNKDDFKLDLIGSLIFLSRNILTRLRVRIWSYINLTNLYFLGIKIGEGNRFLGKSIFNRFPQSKIEIGNNCMFNSVKYFNLIGVNHCCMISTQSRNAFLRIGNNCGLSGASIAAFLHISLGNNVRVGANVLITDSDWHPGDYRTGESLPVIIKDNVWLGYNSVILKGVTIGENSLIGANSLVTKDIPANVIAAGNPCKIIKTIK